MTISGGRCTMNERLVCWSGMMEMEMETERNNHYNNLTSTTTVPNGTDRSTGRNINRDRTQTDRFEVASHARRHQRRSFGVPGGEKGREGELWKWDLPEYHHLHSITISMTFKNQPTSTKPEARCSDW